MEFFNKKEEVIDLQLTQYGKELLSIGKFKPVYYGFYDQEVLYDIKYGGSGSAEAQNDAEPRIQSDTLSLKTQYVFHGIDEYVTETAMMNPYGKEIEELQAQIIEQEAALAALSRRASPTDAPFAARRIQSNMERNAQKIAELQAIEIAVDVFTGETTSTAERTQILYNPLGDSDLGSNKAPSWNIAFLGGKAIVGQITSSLAVDELSTILDIPQIGAEVVYNVSIGESEDTHISEIIDDVIKGNIDGVPQDVLESQLAILDDSSLNDTSIDDKIFDDNTFLKISPDDLIIQVIEDNVPLSNKNFEIEIFEVEDANTEGKTVGANTVTKLTPLVFLTDPELVVNDILLDPEDVDDGSIPAMNTTMVDYYFDVEADDEINAATLCAKIENADKNEYKYASKYFNCDDIKSSYQFLDPYAQKDAEGDCE